MKRFDFFCSYDGGGPADEQESPGGEFVRFSDAEAAVKQARIDALEEAKQLFPQPHCEYFGRDIQDAIESLKGTP